MARTIEIPLGNGCPATGCQGSEPRYLQESLLVATRYRGICGMTGIDHGSGET